MEESTNKQAHRPDSLIKSLGGQYNRAGASENQVVIHTMPERFFAIEPVTNKTRRTGVFILAGGAFLLLLILAAAYFYFSQVPAVDNNIVQPNSADSGINSPGTENPAQNNVAAVPKENIPVQNNINSSDAKNPAMGGMATSAEAIVASSSASEIPVNNPDINAPTASTSVPDNQTAAPTIKTALDSDYDGLSDAEESLLGTNGGASDSDADGFGDLSELLNLYNPAGSGLLVVNTGIERYVSLKYAYLFYYPSAWNLSQVGGEDSIMIKTDEGQFFQIITQDNTKGETIEAWYREQFGVEAVRSDQRIYKKGWEGIKGETGFIVYLMSGDKKNIFTLTYNLGVDTTPYYNNIFNMMLGSLESVK